jgi:hypothetical protein
MKMAARLAVYYQAPNTSGSRPAPTQMPSAFGSSVEGHPTSRDGRGRRPRRTLAPWHGPGLAPDPARRGGEEDEKEVEKEDETVQPRQQPQQHRIVESCVAAPSAQHQVWIVHLHDAAMAIFFSRLSSAADVKQIASSTTTRTTTCRCRREEGECLVHGRVMMVRVWRGPVLVVAAPSSGRELMRMTISRGTNCGATGRSGWRLTTLLLNR